MDKFEYKVRAEEIKSLIAQGDYVQAAEIADTIDWRRVKSVMMLCTISDLYKINRRYEDARDMLLLAYDRHPGGRTIVYSLCELSIKMEEFVPAVEYYKEFVQVAPRDTGRYILQYKLYEAQDVSLEERIAVLEELKKRDYREKWAYELAYLYHRVGLSTRCVEECDELILWFGDGKYVIKAMELKMLHHPLTPQQQQKYEYRFQPRYEQQAQQPAGAEQNVSDRGNYEKPMQEPVTDQQPQYGWQGQSIQPEQAMYSQPVQETAASEPEEFEIHVKTMDVSQYNTINLQKELAEGLKEVLGEQDPMIADPVARDIMASMFESDTESLDQIQIEEVDEETLEPEMQESEVFFGETGEIGEVELEPEYVESEADEASSAYVDDQITGQLSIEDILVEWERLKREAAMDEDAVEEAPAVVEEAEVGDEAPTVVEEAEIEEEEPAVVEEAGIDEEVPSVAETTIEEVEELVEIEEVALEEEHTETSQEPDQTLEEGDTEEEQENQELSAESAVVHEELTVTVEEPAEAEDVPETEEAEAEAEDVPETEEAEPEAEDVPETEEAEAEEAEAASEEAPEENTIEQDKPHIRNLTREEKELFGQFIQNRSARLKLVAALDRISLAAYTGNIIVTGDEGMDTMSLARNMIRDVQVTDSNFSGKTAKISGAALNQKDVAAIFEQLRNGALIVQKASGINEKTAKDIYRGLQQESMGIIVVLEDTRKNMNKFLAQNKQLEECFSARMDLEALSNDALVSFGKKYAREMEYSIDEMGVLALHTRIEDMQTIDHAVTIMEVKEIVDDAIYHANRKSIKHFMDVLLGKRYDDEDMIILREKDFA